MSLFYVTLLQRYIICYIFSKFLDAHLYCISMVSISDSSNLNHRYTACNYFFLFLNLSCQIISDKIIWGISEFLIEFECISDETSYTAIDIVTFGRFLAIFRDALPQKRPVILVILYHEHVSTLCEALEYVRGFHRFELPICLSSFSALYLQDELGFSTHSSSLSPPLFFFIDQAIL